VASRDTQTKSLKYGSKILIAFDIKSPLEKNNSLSPCLLTLLNDRRRRTVRTPVEIREIRWTDPAESFDTRRNAHIRVTSDERVTVGRRSPQALNGNRLSISRTRYPPRFGIVRVRGGVGTPCEPSHPTLNTPSRQSARDCRPPTALIRYVAGNVCPRNAMNALRPTCDRRRFV
jgi:hypothetical protein